jgi:hypothetical protein
MVALAFLAGVVALGFVLVRLVGVLGLGLVGADSATPH